MVCSEDAPNINAVTEEVVIQDSFEGNSGYTNAIVKEETQNQVAFTGYSNSDRSVVADNRVHSDVREHKFSEHQLPPSRNEGKMTATGEVDDYT